MSSLEESSSDTRKVVGEVNRNEVGEVSGSPSNTASIWLLSLPPHAKMRSFGSVMKRLKKMVGAG